MPSSSSTTRIDAMPSTSPVAERGAARAPRPAAGLVADRIRQRVDELPSAGKAIGGVLGESFREDVVDASAQVDPSRSERRVRGHDVLGENSLLPATGAAGALEWWTAGDHLVHDDAEAVQ